MFSLIGQLEKFTISLLGLETTVKLQGGVRPRGSTLQLNSLTSSLPLSLSSPSPYLFLSPH